MQKIKANLREPTPQGFKKTLKKLRIQKRNNGISYLLSEITEVPIPEVSENTMRRAELMFTQLDKKVPYYPDVIYEISYEIEPNHPRLGWIPRRLTQ